MKTREEIEKYLKETIEYSKDANNYSDSMEYGIDLGWIDALNWVLGNK